MICREATEGVMGDEKANPAYSIFRAETEENHVALANVGDNDDDDSRTVMRWSRALRTICKLTTNGAITDSTEYRMHTPIANAFRCCCRNELKSAGPPFWCFVLCDAITPSHQ